MKSVYITGIAGLIGSSLAKHFLLNGWYVSGCDNLIGGYESNVPKSISWDRTPIDKLPFITNHNPLTTEYGTYDVIIHTAALAYEGLSVFSPSLITNSIYSDTIRVASLAIQGKCPLFINCSSMARYGAIKPPFSEYDKPMPVDPYGLAKLQAEKQLELLEDIYPQFKSYTVVPHNVSGAQQVYNDPYRNVLSIMIHQSLQGLPIFIYGDGNQKRSFSHVDDCVNAIYTLINTQPEERLFNIGPDHNEITINDLAEIVRIRTASKSEIIHLNPRPREVKEAYCSSDTAKSILGYKAIKTLDEIIDDIIEFIMLNGFKRFRYDLPIEISQKQTPITWSYNLFGSHAWKERMKSYEEYNSR